MTDTQDDLSVDPELTLDSIPDSSEVASLESVIADLTTMGQSIQVRGVSRADAAMLAQADALPARYPVNSYTETPSQTNLTVTMDSVFGRIKETADKIWSFLVDLFEKFINWAMNGKRSDPKETKADAVKAEEKANDLKEAVKKAPDKTEAEKIVEGKDSELAPLKENEERTYTDLVRACYNHSLWITDLLSYHRVLKAYINATADICETLSAVYSAASAVKTATEFDALLARLTSSNEEYEGHLNSLSEYMLKTEIPGLPFKKAEKGSITIKNIGSAIQTASRTPAKIPMERDFPLTLSPVTKARNIIADYVQSFRDEESKSKTEYAKLRKALASLKSIKPNNLYRSPFAKENKAKVEELIVKTRNVLKDVQDVNRVLISIPETVLENINRHIHASIRFSNAARQRM